MEGTGVVGMGLFGNRLAVWPRLAGRAGNWAWSGWVNVAVSHPVQGALDAHPASVQDVGVEHGGADAGVAQEFLDGPDIVSVFKQVGGEAVPEGVAGGAFLEAARPDRPLLSGSTSFTRRLRASWIRMPDP